MAPDVPSRSADASPDHCARELASEMERGGEDGIVLVLHSLAGVLAAPLAELLGPRLRHCVYVSAVVPPPGRAFVDALGFPNSLVLRVLFRLHRNGLKPSPAMIRQELCNDLDPDQAEQVIRRYQAEFPGLYLRPSTALKLPASSTYVRLSEDKSIPPARQDAIASRLGPVRTESIASGHLPMLSQPQALAGILDEIVSSAR